MLSLQSKLFKRICNYSRLFNLKTICVHSRSFNPTIIGKIDFKNYSFQSQSLVNFNTNVSKDVMLFKYDNPKYFKYLNLFGISQFVFWMYLSYFSFNTLKDAPVSKEDRENLPWWRKINLGEQNNRNGISLFCGIVGYLFLIASWSYTIRAVRFLVLNKGGKVITIVTYGPFGKNAMMNVPVTRISAAESRENARVQLPLKVEGKYFYYMLDMRGEFPNKLLFDATAGLKRKLY